MGRTKKPKEKPDGKLKGIRKSKRAVKNVDRQSNQKLKMNWELCEKKRVKKRNRERQKAFTEKKKAEGKFSKTSKNKLIFGQMIKL